ncbi:hypothetical protein NSP_48900 [Nodularia spumigena CCY9414]|nr:hypothetical protein NSP_48900 [Nodularia spumigena CCY9414]
MSPLPAPPEIPPQRGEEKDKPLIWEGIKGWGAMTVGIITNYADMI